MRPQTPMLSSEFMVEEHELRKEKIQEDYNDQYWDRRYTVLPRQIPSFLQKMAGKVLSTGERGRLDGRACVRPPGVAACLRRAGPRRAVCPDAQVGFILSPDPRRLSHSCSSVLFTVQFLELSPLTGKLSLCSQPL